MLGIFVPINAERDLYKRWQMIPAQFDSQAEKLNKIAKYVLNSPN